MSDTRIFSNPGIAFPLRCKPLALFCMVAAGTAQADVLDPAKVNYGPIEIVPTLTLSQAYDDNLYQDAVQVEDYWVRTAAWQIKTTALEGPHQYGLDYRGEAGYVESSAEDDYVDHHTTLRGLWEFAPRHHVLLEGTYLQEHDRRGTDYVLQQDRDTLLDDPARYQLGSVLGRYIFGSKGAQGRLELEGKRSDKEYSNLREFTALSDLNNTYAAGTFFWRLVGNVEALFEIKQGEISYDKDPASVVGVSDTLDSDYASYLAGVTWQVAGSTTGTVKVGHATKDFADDDREDFAGTSWSAEISWLPRNYSELIFSTGRRTDESNGRGDFIDGTDWGVSWRHAFTERLESRLGYRQSNESYEDDPQGREDDIVRYDLAVDYAFRRWLAVGVFYTKDSYESTVARYDYPREVAGVQLRTSL